MKKETWLDALEALDPALIEDYCKTAQALRAEREKRRARRAAAIKWGTLAACLVLLLGLGVAFGGELLGSLPAETTVDPSLQNGADGAADNALLQSTPDGGTEAPPATAPSTAALGTYAIVTQAVIEGEPFPVRAHREDVSIAIPAVGIIFPWEYRTAAERWARIEVDGRIYYHYAALEEGSIASRIGSYEAESRDLYAGGDEIRRQTFEAFAVKGLTVEKGIAFLIDGTYYLYFSHFDSVREAPQYFFTGEVVEIGEGYLLIDDTALCADAAEGRVFKVLTDDPYFSRCVAYSGYGIHKGSFVVLGFAEPILVGEDNTVRGAISIEAGYLVKEGHGMGGSDGAIETVSVSATTAPPQTANPN